MKIINTVWKRLTHTGFCNLLLLSSIFIIILFVENGFFPKSLELTKLNIFGRTSVVLAFLFVVIFFVMERRRLFALKKIEFDLKVFLVALAIHLFTFLAFIKLKYEVVTRPEILANNLNFYFLVFLRYLFPLIMFLSLGVAFFGITIVKKFYKSFLISLVFAYLFFQISLFFQRYWEFFSFITTTIVTFLLKFSFKEVFIKFDDTSPHGPLLSADGFRAYIDNPCSGVEGLTLFIFLNLLIFILDHKEINKLRSVAVLVAGLLGVYGLNILRVYLVFVFAILYDPKFAISIYHTNAGWILFIFYFIIYWLIIYYFIRKKANKIKDEIKYE